jgi:hypothetical protein
MKMDDIERQLIAKALGGNVTHLMGNLAPAGKLAGVHGVGAGGRMGSKAMSAGGKQHGAGNFPLARAQAKKQGQRAGKQLAQGAGTHGASPATESANAGWNSKSAAWSSLPKTSGGKAPVGMRGKIAGRSNTSAQQASWKAFL